MKINGLSIGDKNCRIFLKQDCEYTTITYRTRPIMGKFGLSGILGRHSIRALRVGFAEWLQAGLGTPTAGARTQRRHVGKVIFRCENLHEPVRESIGRGLFPQSAATDVVPVMARPPQRRVGDPECGRGIRTKYLPSECEICLTSRLAGLKYRSIRKCPRGSGEAL